MMDMELMKDSDLEDAYTKFFNKKAERFSAFFYYLLIKKNCVFCIMPG